MQVIPLISPGGINYEVHSVGFRVAFARDRSRRGEHRRRPIRQETKNATREEEAASAGRKRKSIISRVRLPRSIKFVKFRRENNAPVSPVRRHRVPVPRAENIAPSSSWAIQGGKKETCWRRHYRYLISRSLARPAVPLESVVYVLIRSLRVRRVEPEIVPTRFCNGERGAEGGSRFKVLSPGTHRGHTYAFTRINRGHRDNRARWVNYHRVATSFANGPPGEVTCIGLPLAVDKTLTRKEAIVCVRIRAAPLLQRIWEGKKGSASMSAAPVARQNRIEMDVVHQAKSKWRTGKTVLHTE